MFRNTTKLKVKVKVTLRLAVYRQSVRFGAKPLEDHDQRFLSSTSSLTEDGVFSYEYAWSFVKCTHN
jgi:hypothetical protein